LATVPKVAAVGAINNPAADWERAKREGLGLAHCFDRLNVVAHLLDDREGLGRHRLPVIA
jgi:hypothetical protein